jgi:hypothetical protein
VRADVDGPLKKLYGVLAEDLKEALLIWDAKWSPPEAGLFFDTRNASNCFANPSASGATTDSRSSKIVILSAPSNIPPVSG